MRRKTAIMCGILCLLSITGTPVYSLASVQEDTIRQEEQKNENYSTQTSEPGNSESEEESNKKNDTQDRVPIEEAEEEIETKEQSQGLSSDLDGDLLEQKQEDPIKETSEEVLEDSQEGLLEEITEDHEEKNQEEFIKEELDESIEDTWVQDRDTYLSWFRVDGGYEEWRELPHTDISWYSPDSNQVHQGALYLDNDILYAHFQMNDAYRTQMVVSYMELMINGDTKVTITIQKSTPDGDIDWNENMYQLPVGTTTGLDVFYNEYPKYYMGEAAFTVYDEAHEIGDEVEFAIDLNVIASITNIPVESMKQIQLFNPNIGQDAICIAGGSSGAVFGVILACIVAGGAVWLTKSKKKVVKEDELVNTY